MVKLLVTGIWVCGITLAAVYFSIQTGLRKDDVVPVPGLLGGYEKVRGEITSIPVISDGAVQGYFLTRLSYTVDPVKMKRMTIPAEELVTDTLYTELLGNRVIDFPDMKTFDLKKFKTDILTALNARIGEKVFHDVIVEQIDFLSKSDIRTNMQDGEFDMNPASIKTPEEWKQSPK